MGFRLPGVESDCLAALAQRIVELAVCHICEAEERARARLLRALGHDIAPEPDLVLPDEVPRVRGYPQGPGRDEQRHCHLECWRYPQRQPLDNREKAGAEGDRGADAGEVHPMLEDDVADR